MSDQPAVRRITRVGGVGNSESLAYAQCVVANGFVYVAGQSGIDEYRRVVGPSFREQAVRTFQNVATVLDAAGSGLARLVSITVYITDPRHAPQLIEVRKEVLGPHLPASTLVTGVGLADPAWLVEVDAVALQGDAGGPAPSGDEDGGGGGRWT